MTQKLSLGVLWAAALAACGPGKGTTDPTGDSSTTEGETTSDVPTDPSNPSDPSTPTNPTEGTSDATTDGPPQSSTVALFEQNAVDILFVLDNSGSMAEEQATLAGAVPGLLDGLAGLDWRIGMTTTDAGNPRCPTSTPEDGALVLSSCLDRVAQGEFVILDNDFSAACTDRCGLSDAELQVLPTATEVDKGLVPRKWVESTSGALNIEGASAAEALQCYLPQGVAGCGFESHLQSMFRALARSADAGDPNNFGFMRAAAVQAVVMVSDETDCSFAPTQSDIFTVNTVFWEDPDAPAPTSAMCWNAGVACSGSAPTWDECHAENWDANGNPGASDADAVLPPVAQFVDFVQSIEQQKQSFDPIAQVVVALIAGVPIGYESFGAELVYQDSPDVDFQGTFGIGPGCIVGPVNSPTATAVPPVREREWAEAFAVNSESGRNLHSICSEDYSGALLAVVEQIRDQIRPLCMPNCVADTDQVTAVLEPNCELFEEDLVNQTKVPVAQCIEAQGVWVPPANETVCFAALVDKDGAETPSQADDMSPVCVDEGFNLEFKIVRTAPKPIGTTLSAACELSPDKTKDCPNL